MNVEQFYQAKNHARAWVLLMVALAAGVGTANAQSTPGSFKPKVILITGSTDGLGRGLALKLASTTGARIIVHGRNAQRGMEVVKEIEKDGGSAKFYQADLASFDQVRKLAEQINKDYDHIDLLINNAGISLDTNEGRKVTGDGVEMTMEVNYFSGYLLTRMLLPKMVASAPARIVHVSSNGQANATINFDNIMQEKNFDGQLAYRMSKLAQVMFTFDLAEELKGKNVICTALHPASQMDTNMILSRGGTPQSTTEEGVQAVMRAALHPDVKNGQYFQGQKLVDANPQAYDLSAREKLRTLSVKLTGIGAK